MKTILITISLAILFALILGFIWVCIHLLARYRLGERSGKACEIAGNTSEHCCQYIEQCPEEIRRKCKHAVIKS
ncbi:MAG TPA: hypothetical protein PLA12_02485 [Candidatus Hydrogenedens sp.]|nr:hypothetical protein [Candidatus Hydrogenedens sp.]